MNSPVVAVLMSTYNGEVFLRDQLNSLISQDYHNFKIYVRDDGSVDNTKKILSEYMQKGIITIICDNLGNLGPARSFLTLLKLVEADVFMFCDQDDVWLGRKISKAIAEIARIGFHLPVLFHSDLRVIDKHGKLYDKSFMALERLSNCEALNLNVLAVQNCVVGCTIAFTKSLKQGLLKDHKSVVELDIAMHDWWIALYSSCFGTVIFDSEALILYRQHGNNASGISSTSILDSLLRFDYCKRINLLRMYKLRIAKQAHLFIQEFDQQLSHEQHSILFRVSAIAGKYWFISWLCCLYHRIRFDRAHMNFAFLLVGPAQNVDRWLCKKIALLYRKLEAQGNK